MYDAEKKNRSKELLSYLPRHVAIIMDGNSRWAKKIGKLRICGHKAGVNSVRCAVNFAVRNQLDVLTLYAFSSENWCRSSKEVSSLMDLFILYINKEVKSLHNNNISLRVIGDISRFNKRLQECIYKSEDLTCNNNGLILNIAANYGGRWDIIQGVRQIAEKVKKGILAPNKINENTLCNVICMNELAPVDLLIRTGGEYRISNFLLWQIAYAELFFTDVLWPDFNNTIFEQAINAFAKRKRRFGGRFINDNSI